jgi:hypothetical protein
VVIGSSPLIPITSSKCESENPKILGGASETASIFARSLAAATDDEYSLPHPPVGLRGSVGSEGTSNMRKHLIQSNANTAQVRLSRTAGFVIRRVE